MIEINDDEIIRALRICTSPDSTAACSIDCPFGEVGCCQELLMSHALRLIEKQREEQEMFSSCAKSAFDSITKALIEDNKRISDTVDTLHGVLASKDKIINGLTEEVEVIKAELETRPPRLIITRKV